MTTPTTRHSMKRCTTAAYTKARDALHTSVTVLLMSGCRYYVHEQQSNAFVYLQYCSIPGCHRFTAVANPDRQHPSRRLSVNRSCRVPLYHSRRCLTRLSDTHHSRTPERNKRRLTEMQQRHDKPQLPYVCLIYIAYCVCRKKKLNCPAYVAKS